MMKRIVCTAAAALALSAGVAAAGPVGEPIPTNPCPATNHGTLKLGLIANEVAVGGGFGGTMAVCYHVGKSTIAPMDVAVQTFDEFGGLIGTASTCNLAPSASASFLATTYAAPLPYTGIATPYGGSSGRGSLRVLSTNPGKVACDVTLFDTHTLFGAPALLWTKDVTVTRAAGAQKGD